MNLPKIREGRLCPLSQVIFANAAKYALYYPTAVNNALNQTEYKYMVLLSNTASYSTNNA